MLHYVNIACYIMSTSHTTLCQHRMLHYVNISCYIMSTSHATLCQHRIQHYINIAYNIMSTSHATDCAHSHLQEVGDLSARLPFHLVRLNYPPAVRNLGKGEREGEGGNLIERGKATLRGSINRVTGYTMRGVCRYCGSPLSWTLSRVIVI